MYAESLAKAWRSINFGKRKRILRTLTLANYRIYRKGEHIILGYSSLDDLAANTFVKYTCTPP